MDCDQVIERIWILGHPSLDVRIAFARHSLRSVI